MWIDTHCHLDAAEFAADRDQVVAAAHAAGVTRIVVPGVQLSGFPAIKDCCQRYAGCLPAYGIHPMYTAMAQSTDLLTLRDWVLREQPGWDHTRIHEAMSAGRSSTLKLETPVPVLIGDRDGDAAGC